MDSDARLERERSSAAATPRSAVEQEGRWYGVRAVIDHGGALYEERITLWQADSFDEALALAQDEATDYAMTFGATALDFVSAYHLAVEPGVGVEVFSLIRESDLDPDRYLTAFFDTGTERCQPDTGTGLPDR